MTNWLGTAPGVCKAPGIQGVPLRVQDLLAVFALFAVSALSVPSALGAANNGTRVEETGAPSSPGVVQSDHPWFSRGALDLNIYGMAYHPDRETVHEKDLDNEFNPGVGLHYEVRNTPRGVTFAEIGAYEDSGNSVAAFLGLGYQFKFGERWRVGGALALMNSETYNQGTSFVAMFPVVTYVAGRFKLNGVYFPKFGNYNQVAAFGFYLGIPLGGKDPD